MIIQFIEFLRHRMKIVIGASLAVLVLLVVLDAFPFIVNKEHAHTAIERIPGFWSLFGFLSCVLIIFASKWFGHSGIMQKEDYYTKQEDTL